MILRYIFPPFDKNSWRPRPHYPGGIWKRSFLCPPRPTVNTNPSRKWSLSKTRRGSRKFTEKRGPSPPSSPRMKTSLQPDCIIITTLDGRLEGLGSYKNVLKIQKRGGGRGPSLKSTYENALQTRGIWKLWLCVLVMTSRHYLARVFLKHKF